MEQPRFVEIHEEKFESTAKLMFVIFLSVFLLVFFFIIGMNAWFQANYKFYTVSGQSMQPTLNPSGGPREIVDGVYLKFTKDFDYKDIIIIENQLDDPNADPIIKRVIAREGDMVTILMGDENSWGNEYRVVVKRKDSQQYEVLYEDYIGTNYLSWSRTDNPKSEIVYNNIYRYESAFYSTFLDDNSTITGQGEVLYCMDKDSSFYGAKFFKVGKERIFYMGDNRANSTDSRVKGCAKVQDIDGKVVSIIRNIEEKNKAGMLGIEKFMSIMGYFFENIVKYFAWNG